MSRSSPFVITLSDADRAELERRSRCYTAPYAEVIRARIVLLAADHLENMVIAARLDVHVDAVSLVAEAEIPGGPAGLDDRQCSGRPRGASCCGGRAGSRHGRAQPPQDPGVVAEPRWSVAGPGRECRRGGRGGVGAAVDGVAAAARGRHPAGGGRRLGIFPRHPEFNARAHRVLDLVIQRTWDGAELGDGEERRTRIDEKSQRQTPSRRHRGGRPRSACSGGLQLEDERHGIVAYLAAYDVDRAH